MKKSNLEISLPTLENPYSNFPCLFIIFPLIPLFKSFVGDDLFSILQTHIILLTGLTSSIIAAIVAWIITLVERRSNHTVNVSQFDRIP